MFPFDIDDDEEENEEIKEEIEVQDWEIDFRTGKLTGRTVTGMEAIKQWVRLVLTIDRYVFAQYSWDFGNDLSMLIGQHYDEDYIKSEVKRMIEDALLINEDITEIENFEHNFIDGKLVVGFTLNTVYGSDEMREIEILNVA